MIYAYICALYVPISEGKSQNVYIYIRKKKKIKNNKIILLFISLYQILKMNVEEADILFYSLLYLNITLNWYCK